MNNLEYLKEEILHFQTKKQKEMSTLKHLTYSGWGVWKDIHGNSHKWNDAKHDFEKVENVSKEPEQTPTDNKKVPSVLGDEKAVSDWKKYLEKSKSDKSGYLPGEDDFDMMVRTSKLPQKIEKPIEKEKAKETYQEYLKRMRELKIKNNDPEMIKLLKPLEQEQRKAHAEDKARELNTKEIENSTLNTEEPITNDNLPIGQILKLHGYGDYNYVIVNRTKQNPDRYSSHKMNYDVVNLTTLAKAIIQSDRMPHITEKRPGIGWSWSDKKISNEEVESYKNKAEQKLRDDMKAEEQAKKDNAILREKLIKDNPDLMQAKDFNGRGSLAAKNIRTELKKAFKGIKFGIRSDYSSVDVTWDNGPSADEVDKIIDKYSQGSFNGMEDIYEYNKNTWADIFGGAKYINSHRHISSDKFVETAKEHGYDEKIFDSLESLRPADYKNDNLVQIIRQETYKKSFKE